MNTVNIKKLIATLVHVRDNRYTFNLTPKTWWFDKRTITTKSSCAALQWHEYLTGENADGGDWIPYFGLPTMDTHKLLGLNIWSCASWYNKPLSSITAQDMIDELNKLLSGESK